MGSAPVPALSALNRTICCALLLLLPILASAQTPATPNSQLAWDMAGTSKASADLHAYELSVDGGTFSALGSIVCVEGSLVTCRAPLPALTDGRHLLRVRSRRGDAVSEPSNALDITMVAIVTPSGLRLETVR